MDPEKQPLLKSTKYLRQRFRPLTPEEVLRYTYNETWRQIRLSLLFLFWFLITFSVIIIMWLLGNDPCTTPMLEASVSPAHLSLVPLIYSERPNLELSLI